MKLVVIFNKDISNGKVAVHTGHASREVTYQLLVNGDLSGYAIYAKWKTQAFRTVVLTTKDVNSVLHIVNKYLYKYTIQDAGLDGKYENGEVLGYACLVEDGAFKRLRLWKGTNE